MHVEQLQCWAKKEVLHKFLVFLLTLIGLHCPVQ